MTIEELKSRFENSRIWKQWKDGLFSNSDASTIVQFWTNYQEEFHLHISTANTYLDVCVKVKDCSFSEGLLQFNGFRLYLGYDTGEVVVF